MKMKMDPEMTSELSFNDAGSGFDTPLSLSLPGWGGHGGMNVGAGPSGTPAPAGGHAPAGMPAGAAKSGVPTALSSKGGWFTPPPQHTAVSKSPTGMQTCIANATKFMGDMQSKGCLSSGQVSSIRSLLHL